MRHAPYAVDRVVHDEWMLCMRQTIQEQVPDAAFQAWLLGNFSPMANHMINTEPAPTCHFGMPPTA